MVFSQKGGFHGTHGTPSGSTTVVQQTSNYNPLLQLGNSTYNGKMTFYMILADRLLELRSQHGRTRCHGPMHMYMCVCQEAPFKFQPLHMIGFKIKDVCVYISKCICHTYTCI